MTESPSTRREELTHIALELLEAEGAEAVSTRKVAAAYGASTMVVYSEFGSLGGLVESVVDRGFDLLRDALAAAPRTADPVSDLIGIARAYRLFALTHPHLYRVIYAVSPLAGHRRAGAELLQGVAAFEVMHEALRRAFRGGVLTIGTPYDAARTAWLAFHGAVLGELAGYVEAMPAATRSPLDELVRTLVVGFGGDPAGAAASLEAAGQSLGHEAAGPARPD